MIKYIELETIINEFDYQSQFYDAEWGNKRFAPDDVEMIIRSIPIADVAPVRHGTAILKEDGRAHCSQCDCPVNSRTWNYCPNCGARLDDDRK